MESLGCIFDYTNLNSNVEGYVSSVSYSVRDPAA
jgi:hypothetical protein